MNLYCISGYPGYKIDEFGNVYSHKGGFRQLQTTISNGYYTVSLMKYGKQYTRQVHRIMGELYLNCPKDRQVNHIDGNKLNNKLENLEIVSALDNITHAKILGMMSKQKLPVQKRRDLLESAKLLQDEIGGTITDCLKWLSAT